MTFLSNTVQMAANPELAHKLAKYAFNSPEFSYSRACGLCRAEVVHDLTQHNCLIGRL